MVRLECFRSLTAMLHTVGSEIVAVGLNYFTGLAILFIIVNVLSYKPGESGRKIFFFTESQ